jgi:hypothetical protein
MWWMARASGAVAGGQAEGGPAEGEGSAPSVTPQPVALRLPREPDIVLNYVMPADACECPHRSKESSGPCMERAPVGGLCGYCRSNHAGGQAVPVPVTTAPPTFRYYPA